MIGEIVGHDALVPSGWVKRWAELVAPGSKVLDIACGNGRHAKLFAARGCKVTAIDRDAALAAAFEAEPNVQFIAADLENDATDYRSLIPDHCFDCIVVTNYLHRPLFPTLIGALAPNGLLIYETFAAGNAEFGKPRNPDFLLKPRELLDTVAGELRVVAFEDGYVAESKPAMIQRIAARKAEPRSRLPAERCRL